MVIEYRLPDLGEGIESGDVVSLLVQEGEMIEAEQSVVELETDKAVLEVPCPHAGKVAKIHIKPGDTIPVGALLITIEPSGAGAQAPAAEETLEVAEAAVEPKALPREPKEKKTAKKPAKKQKREPAKQVAAKAKQPAAPEAAPEEEAAEREVSEPPPSPRRAPAAVKAAAKDGRTAADRHRTAPAGPATRRLARELGVDLAQVSGSGSGGRITREDVMAAVREMTARGSGAAAAPAAARAVTPRAGEEDAAAPEQQDAWGAIRRERLTRIRKTIAANMSGSWETIPHVTNFDEADITELDAIRRESLQDYLGINVKLTMMPFLMKAVAGALRKNPMLNASLDLENGEIVYKHYVNLGLAVDTERGLIVPVVRNADEMSIPQLALALSTVAEQARTGKFALEDLRGGSFTISNMGAVGGIFSTPIINPPEVAVLLVGRSKKMPTVVDDRIEPRLLMPLSLSYDHRLVDGAAAARFLNDVKGYLGSPGRLLLAP